jgi:hypothetical protein
MNTLPIKTFPKRRGADAVNLALLGLLSTVAWTQPAQAVTPPPATLVSLTFDDGLTQSAARAILAKHGMKGTFYINSNMIGSGGTYLTKAELDAIYADGNEIGGHTLNHVDLATQSDADQKTAICSDMQNLVNWGYQVHSFAYPYGSTGLNTQAIVKAGCGAGVGTYESARTVGNLVTGTTCNGCSFAETIQPVNSYYISTNESVIATTPLAEIQGYVTQAENHGGGWVPLVFHRVCDNACDTYSVSPATLDAFLTWLEARQAQNTLVRTVHQVMSGDTAITPPPPPPVPNPNVLLNPSLEKDTNNDGQPDCWARDKYGSNSATWTRTADAHSGGFAQQLKVTKYSSGDLKLLPTLDAGQPGGCAPAVKAGQLYQHSAWYKSTVPAFSAFFYLDANNVWQYWTDGPALPASTGWTQMTYQPGAVPLGAKAVSFGVALERIGTLITDDYSMTLLP